jgi:cyclic pyranopterin phosphate synthase
VKVNVVVKRGLNEGSVLDIARRFRGTGTRCASSSSWTSARRTAGARRRRARGRDRRRRSAPSSRSSRRAAYRGEVAERYRYLDGAGEIGVIASVTQPFCGDCTRARISADGKLYTCLFAVRGHDLRALLRSDSSGDLEETIRAVWERRADRYSELRTAETSALRKVEMSYIGG